MVSITRDLGVVVHVSLWDLVLLPEVFDRFLVNARIDSSIRRARDVLARCLKSHVDFVEDLTRMGLVVRGLCVIIAWHRLVTVILISAAHFELRSLPLEFFGERLGIHIDILTRVRPLS